MKRSLLILLLIGSVMAHRAEVLAADGLSGSITISGAWAIYPTVVAWAEAFQKKYPGVRIDVSAGGAGKGGGYNRGAGGYRDGLARSRSGGTAKDIRAVYILKDAIFPAISEKSFYLQELLEKGIKRQTLADIYIAGTATRWGQIIGTKADKPIHVYTRADSSGAAASWAAYFGKKQEDLRGVGVYGDPGLLDAVKRDPVGIGYSNFGFVFTRGRSSIAGAQSRCHRYERERQGRSG